MAFLSSNPPSRLLILNGNPGSSTLNRAMVEAIAAVAVSRGAEIRIHHLNELRFDANLAEGYHSRMEWEPDLRRLHEDLFWCDRFVLVHPLWWGGAPARLKGLIDRMFLPGVTFRYEAGRRFPVPLLSGRKARIILTSDTPSLILWLLYGNGWLKILRRQILGFCGFSDLKVVNHAPIRGASAERLAGYVRKAPAILD